MDAFVSKITSDGSSFLCSRPIWVEAPMRASKRGAEKPLISPNSGQNYISHFEPGTEFTAGVEPGDPLVSIVCEKLFPVRLGQLSTRYFSPCRAQKN